ncbi:MAG: phage major capsid protein [Clostridia bacterium]|nr:phage major capsid protein [Clostridia bacterium]
MTNEIAELRDLNLELESLNARKAAIKKRLSEHRDEFYDSTVLSDAKREAEEIRSAIKVTEAKIATASKLAEKNQNQEERTIKMETNQKVDMRTAFAKHVLFQSTNGRRADAKLTEMEARALGVATTTTSETYVAPSAEVDGVNNGGIFIPQEVMMDILREEELESPIYRDVVTTAIKGMTKYPYRIYKSGAKTKRELSPNENESIQWDILSGRTGNYTDSIVLTFEIEAMAVADFADYLVGEVRSSMRDLVINDYIYGNGEDDHVQGITNGALTVAYGADARATIESAIAKLPVKKRAGAKIYLASDVFDSMTFAKNQSGDYLLPVLNGGGLTRLSTFAVESDPNLKAGDILIGNVSKWYKANIIKNMEIGLDVSHQHRTKTYTAHMMINAAPVPNSFVYAKKGE